jgi:L-ascorbate metabolism protein UlaG (beta-lactamase superfamily)
MEVRWLGWAGMEVKASGDHLVVDPLGDPTAVFSWLGDRAAGMPAPEVLAPTPGALAGLVTHLHRDHADAAALKEAVGPGGTIYEPAGYGGSAAERLGLAQAEHELSAAGLARTPVDAWSTHTIGPFTVTALPAVDGTGDPQVSWLIEVDGTRVLHLGDTMFHGWWWRIHERFGEVDAVFAPINGARLTFPHRQPASPLPAVLDPEQAALAGELLAAERLIPMHFGAYALPGVYEPVADALERLQAGSERCVVLEPGEQIRL